MFGCQNSSITQPNAHEKFDQSNWALLDGSPDSFKGSTVEIVGKVFTTPERTTSGIGWQMWVDPKSSKFNTVVFLPEPNFAIKNGDSVRVSGSVRGTFAGTNAFGGKISALMIDARTATIVDALAIASRPLSTVNFNVSQRQHDLVLTVEKIEFAEDETRVYLKVSNSSKYKASFYTFNAKAQQGTKQFDSIRLSEYPEVQSDLLSGTESAGVILFPAMTTQPTKLILEARTDNFYLNFKPYVFEFSPESAEP